MERDIPKRVIVFSNEWNSDLTDRFERANPGYAVVNISEAMARDQIENIFSGSGEIGLPRLVVNARVNTTWDGVNREDVYLPHVDKLAQKYGIPLVSHKTGLRIVHQELTGNDRRAVESAYLLEEVMP